MYCLRITSYNVCYTKLLRGLGALQVESMHIANARGSRWADPDLRTWEGDSGSLQRFDWRG